MIWNKKNNEIIAYNMRIVVKGGSLAVDYIIILYTTSHSMQYIISHYLFSIFATWTVKIEFRTRFRRYFLIYRLGNAL